MEATQIYSIINKLDSSIPTYKVPRYYQNTKKQHPKAQSLSKNKFKKTFIASIQKLSKQLPASNKYFQTQKLKKIKSKSISFTKIDFNAKMKQGKKTFIDQYIQQKKYMPGVGKYNPELDKSKQIKTIYKIKNDKKRKQASLFRTTASDQIQNIDALKIGPGNYQTYKAVQFGNTSHKFSFSPQGKFKSKSLPKLPGPFSYTPLVFGTFDKKLHLKRQKNETKNIGCTFTQRYQFKKLDFGPGPKYSLISTWSINNKNSSQLSKNYFNNISNIPQKSIYRS